RAARNAIPTANPRDGRVSLSSLLIVKPHQSAAPTPAGYKNRGASISHSGRIVTSTGAMLRMNQPTQKRDTAEDRREIDARIITEARVRIQTIGGGERVPDPASTCAIHAT